MVIPEMRTAHVPVEIFRLYVEREHIGENGIHRPAYVFDGLARQIGSRRKRCVSSLRQLQSFLRIRFVDSILPCYPIMLLTHGLSQPHHCQGIAVQIASRLQAVGALIAPECLPHLSADRAVALAVIVTFSRKSL